MIDLIQEIYGTIKRNKLRTFLTGFAVAWGIFMLIVLLGAGNGLIHAFEKQAGNMLMNSMKIYPGWAVKPYKGLKGGREIKLDKRDMEITESFTDHVENVGATLGQNDVNLSYREDHVSIYMEGVMPNYVRTEPIKIVKGRFINEPDMKEKRKVIVLHEKTMEMLFGSKDKEEKIGEYVKASGLTYRIVGIYTDIGSNSPSAYIPYSTLRLVYNKEDRLGTLLFITKNMETIESNEQFETEYRKAIGAHQRFDPTDRSAIWIWNRLKQYMQQQTGLGILRTAIWIIGIFTLLSGIVGVSNIMLITVKERTREFGIRKALGARPASILWIIIAESIAITTFFGYIGMVAGIAVTEYMNLMAGSQVMDTGIVSVTVFENPTVDMHIAIQATLTLIIAGTLAGFFPARKAVMVRPIEALRAD